FDFFVRTEGIARTVYEERRRREPGKMLGTQLCGFTWRMQRIGEQEEPGDKFWIFRSEHGGLASAIRMAGKKYPAGRFLAQQINRTTQAFAVAGSESGKRWAMGT